MTTPILVLGALGNVGAEVVNTLLVSDARVRAADLFPEKIRDRFGATVEAVTFDFYKPETFAGATAPVFAGVERAFIMRPPQITDIEHTMVPAMAAAKAAGVKHFVFLSIIGIEQNTIVPHYKVEQYLT